MGYNYTMSYSQLILSDRPAGYWDSPKFGVENSLTSNQSSFETSTSGWSAVDSDTTIARITSDSYIGTACLQATANATASDSIAIRISSGSRIRVYPGRRYTMIARVKRGSGSRNAAIRIEYYTTQSGSTLSEPVRVGNEFTLSSDEWTTIYHTDLIYTPNDNDYYVSWGVVSTNSGSIGDTLLVDYVQFYEGTAFQLEDEVSNNNINVYEDAHENAKPIIFGTNGALKLYQNSFATIENEYKLFISGSELKPATLDFWFTIDKPPSYRHSLVKIGTFLDCYIERDRLYIESGGKKESIQVVDWTSQHYLAISYFNRSIDLYLDNRSPVSISLDENFRFNDIADANSIPSIVIGPSSEPRNLIVNPSIENNTDGWAAIGSGTSISLINTDSFSGSACLRVTKAAVSNSGMSATNRIRVESYKKYQASAYIKIPSGDDASTITIKCNEYDSISSSTPISQHTESILIDDSDGWTRINNSFTPHARTKYIDFSIYQASSGSAGEKFLVDAILLEKSEHLLPWDEKTANYEPLLVSGIGIYPYQIDRNKIQKRLNYATNDLSDNLAIRYGGDRFNTDYSDSYQVNGIDVTTLAKNNKLNIQNLVYTNNGLYMPKVSPILVESGLAGGSFNLEDVGISFTDDCHAVVENINSYFNTSFSTVRLQVELDSLNADGIILSLIPITGYYAFIVKKESDKIVGQLLKEFNDQAPEELFSSMTLGDGEYNVALNFSDRTLSALVGGEEFNDLEFPSIENISSMYIGNLPGLSAGFSDYIRNFCIDNYTDFNDIDWYDPGIYMARFNGNLNVSQKAVFNYDATELTSSNNSIITFNSGAKLNIVVNDEFIEESLNIPGFNYTAPENVNISVSAITEDSLNDSVKINNLYLSTIDSSSISSSLSNFEILQNLDGSSNKINDPYVIKTNNTNILAHDDNLGLKFIPSISSGCKISAKSVDYGCFELVFKINKYPNASEQYTIFDLSGVTNTNLVLSSGSLVKSGDYDLYIDGSIVSNLSNIDILVGEIYHVFVVFDTAIDNCIHIGNNKSVLNTLNGSIGKICVYENTPADIASYVSDKYQDLIGKITKVVSGGTINVKDTPTSQSYYRDDNGEYFEMLDLPKVKFVTSSWEEIDFTN
jgi:hypothetical protein